MQSCKKILCAVDLSDMSGKVARHATAFAKAFDAEVLVVYAAPSSSQYAGFDVQPKALESFVNELSQGAEEQMRKVMAKHFADIRATSRIVSGFPAEEVLAEAERWGADLIVMGTHGRKGVDLLLFGSVAEKVVKGATMPVLTVSPDR
ncbi:universal stress protein [Desulfovibrio sp. OttesenSCG-928-F20]|nr:universal stress protein [Desulfovibrio sp. OttesenSCG-928-F20]